MKFVSDILFEFIQTNPKKDCFQGHVNGKELKKILKTNCYDFLAKILFILVVTLTDAKLVNILFYLRLSKDIVAKASMF